MKDYPHAQQIIDRILTLDEATIREDLAAAIARMDGRHRDVTVLFQRHYDDLRGLSIDRSAIGRDQALLIGAYFSQEFSFESAALFNPSAVRTPTNLASAKARRASYFRCAGSVRATSLR